MIFRNFLVIQMNCLEGIKKRRLHKWAGLNHPNGIFVCLTKNLTVKWYCSSHPSRSKKILHHHQANAKPYIPKCFRTVKFTWIKRQIYRVKVTILMDLQTVQSWWHQRQPWWQTAVLRFCVDPQKSCSGQTRWTHRYQNIWWPCWWDGLDWRSGCDPAGHFIKNNRSLSFLT